MGDSLMKGDAMKETRSMLNPVDLASMKQESKGQITGDMSVRDFLAKVGIDVEGPATQLQQFAKKQVENADPIKKMQNMAAMGKGGGMQGGPPQGQPPQGAPPQGGGLEDLMKGM
jgi:hypothetical protein